jgi:hypothetical protein
MNEEKNKFYVAATVIRAVAEELAKQAKESMPKLQEGEAILQEWYKNGEYCRETTLATHIYDFRLKECHLVKEAKSA